MKETKQLAADPAVRGALHEVMAAFESFKAVNDERLAALEGKRADVVLEEKVARIDQAINAAQARLDRISLEARRPALEGVGQVAPSERKAAFDRYLKTGAADLAGLEAKGLSEGTASAGGYLAPLELEQAVISRLTDASPMRQIAQVRTIGGGALRLPVSTSGVTAAWVAETASRGETTEPVLDVIDIPARDLYASPAATQALLDDAFVNIDQWLAGEVQNAFAGQETDAFINGDGSNKPMGILGYTNAADGSATWGQMGYLATGVSGAFPSSNPTDKLIDLIYTPKAQYRQNGRFVMNRKTVSLVRKFKDSDGNYIWNASLTPGQSATLLGFPITEFETMPDVAADSFSLAFGDFQQGYVIVDRAGVQVLRDPYSAKPYVLFYTTKRVGGAVQNFDAIKLLKFGTS